ncbi:Na+/proline symporter [Marinilabilia salmonicolor]|jgi:Na+/proline symporter|uniref:sodium:solute symporter family protein n=1 Tax=Marinilabilia salmonicolor TaxID=989 RepID=UPI000D07DB88|nr:sodium:solute symporter family protein [Marinilabilia salmonicolor]PRY99879.1 Na+/proline symporter [Marinilabilia salmonicolor]
MNLSLVDVGIVMAYLVLTLFIGFWLSKRASKDLEAYFLGGNKIKWYFLGLSNASGMFDISGTMWTVTIVFVYGLKSAWIPWLWPVWNQIFVMVFLAIWMRRSNTMTGAQWITFRFGDGRGGRLSHIIVVVFAVVSVIGFIAYFVEGIGKFATTFFTWDLSTTIMGLHLTSEQVYALIIIAITTIYTMKGGMYSVVSTEVLQFLIMTVACVSIGIIAYNQVTPEQVAAVVPEGWTDLWPGWELDLDWSGLFPELNDKIGSDGYEMFGMLLMMMLLKGIFASLAGPVPSYDMQRILSTRTPSEAAKMSGLTSLVLFIPRYLMIGGFAVLGLVYLKPELMKMGADIDFEMVLPLAIRQFVPVGIKGLLLAGLLAAFMGTFAAFINAAPAYLVNDLYKKYVNPQASNKKLVRYSYMSSLILVVVGIAFGLFAKSLNSLTLWITSSLYGGYAAANVLKWIWWRFNGMGYFFGMLGGLIASVVVPPSVRIFVPGAIDIYIFPLILLVSMAASVLGTLFTKPEDMRTLKTFYKQTRPWGFWKPVKEAVMNEDPSFVPNKDFKRDAFNVVVGITWQMSMVVLPLYFLSGEYSSAWVSLGVFIGTSVLLKFFWYDHIKNMD